MRNPLHISLIGILALSATTLVYAQRAPAIPGVTGTIVTPETAKDEKKAEDKAGAAVKDAVTPDDSKGPLSDLTPGTTIHYTLNGADPTEADAFNAVYRPDTQRLQLEIFDSHGRAISWFPSVVNSETSRVTLTLNNPGGPAALKELRYYTLTRATINIPFEFKDIPMP